MRVRGVATVARVAAVTLAAGIAAGCARGESAPAPGQELPEGVTAAMVEAGRALYAGDGFCYTCHGPDGAGVAGLGADLTDDEWLHADGSYPSLVSLITEGVRAERSRTGVPMPPRGGARLTDEQVRAVAAYVWTLSRR